MKVKIVLLLLTISVSAFANTNGYGGDAVVCRNQRGKITSAELLDYYEGRVYRRIPHFSNSQVGPDEFFKEMKRVVEIIDSSFWATENFLETGMLLWNEISTFRELGTSQNKELIFTNETLNDVPDVTTVVPDKGCAIEQVLIELREPFPGDPKFILQSEIVMSLDEDSLRGLVLNLLLNKVFLKGSDSTDVRYLHQKITSVPFGKINFKFLVLIKTPLYTTINNNIISLFEELPTGELLYNKMYVLNADGVVQKERTLELGKIDAYFSLIGDNGRGVGTGVHITDAHVTIRFPNGNVETINTQNREPIYEFTAGLVEVKINIPGRSCRPSWFEEPMVNIKLELQTKSHLYREILSESKCSGRQYNIFKKFLLTLNDKLAWTFIEVKNN